MNVPISRKEVLFEKACYDSEHYVYDFHVDDDELFMNLTSNLPPRGHESIQKNPSSKIRIVFGQDESVFEPHLLRRSFWTFKDHIPHQKNVGSWHNGFLDDN